MTPQYTVLVTDSDLAVVGDPIDEWTSLDATLRWNEPSSGTLDVPAHPHVMAQLEPGNRLMVLRDGDVLISGPIESPLASYQWGIGGDNAEPGQVTVGFADDLAYLSGRLVYPNPAQAATAQTASHYATSGAAGTVMLALANLNAGPGALAARQIGPLAMGAGTGLGSTVSTSARFAPLLDELRAAATVGGGLGFRVRQVDDELVFEVFEPADLTAAARFSRGLGNLRSITVEQAAPTVTHAIVGGQGEAENRTVAERADTTAAARWWRIEKWADARNEDTAGGLDQSGDEALVEGAEQVRIAAVTIDTPDLRFGSDFGLGDLVTVEYLPGVDIAAPVRQAQVQATPEAGEYITVLVGSQEASTDPEWVREVRRLRRRLARVETGTDVP